ncbi:hypothetical protein Tco_0611344, partial [Tanacetum coccineum]
SLAEEKYCLLGAKDKEIEDLKSQLLKAKEESVVVAQLRTDISKITRNPPKRSNTDTRNGRAQEKPKIQSQSQEKSTLELHQLDTFYNALNANDQDSLNSAAGGNFLDKMPRECLRIIESKSKLRIHKTRQVVAKRRRIHLLMVISPDVAASLHEVSKLRI